MNLEPIRSGPLPDAAMRTGFLLIDAANIDGESFNDLPMIGCVHRLLANSDSLMPRLIDLAALTPPQQDGLVEARQRELTCERPPVICAWINTLLDASALARNISRFLVGPGADNALVFWRYFDPRVFTLALAVFKPEQTQALLGGIMEWHFPWRGRWWRVGGHSREADSLKGIAPAWPTAIQWKSLENSSVMTRVLTQIQDVHGTQTDAVCLAQLLDIDVFILDARNRLQLEDESDLVGYSLMRWEYGSEFRHHPKLADAWDKLAGGSISWGELTTLLDENDYQAMNVRVPVKGVQEEHLYATL